MSGKPSKKKTIEHDKPAQNQESLDSQRLHSLINSMADGVIALDEKAKVIMYNGAALNILDLNSSIEGKRLSDVAELVDKNNQPVDIQHMVLGAKILLTNRDMPVMHVTQKLPPLEARSK